MGHRPRCYTNGSFVGVGAYFAVVLFSWAFGFENNFIVKCAVFGMSIPDDAFQDYVTINLPIFLPTSPYFCKPTSTYRQAHNATVSNQPRSTVKTNKHLYYYYDCHSSSY
jgi:hypothetical protein